MCRARGISRYIVLFPRRTNKKEKKLFCVSVVTNLTLLFFVLLSVCHISGKEAKNSVKNTIYFQNKIGSKRMRYDEEGNMSIINGIGSVPVVTEAGTGCTKHGGRIGSGSGSRSWGGQHGCWWSTIRWVHGSSTGALQYSNTCVDQEGRPYRDHFVSFFLDNFFCNYQLLVTLRHILFISLFLSFKRNMPAYILYCFLFKFFLFLFVKKSPSIYLNNYIDRQSECYSGYVLRQNVCSLFTHKEREREREK